MKAMKNTDDTYCGACLHKAVAEDRRKTLRVSVLLAWLTVFAALLTSAGTSAQTHWQLGVGTTHILDTYLSQEKFHGTGLALLTTSERCRDSARWSAQWQHQLHLSTADDRAGNASLIEAMYKLFYGRYRSIGLTPRLQLQAGAMAGIGLGAIYNTRNGNNPVQARAGLHVMPSVKATYRFSILKKEARLRYQLDLPLAGLVFSPNYGQSYYEMFTLGNYDHNIVPVTFVAAPSFRQQLALLFRAGRKITVSMGYLGDYHQLKVNNLKQHVYDHTLMVGIMKNI